MNALWLASHFTVPAPVGRKYCAEAGCTHTLPTTDKHARCQKCRNAGGYLRAKYEAACPICGVTFIKPKTAQETCSLACGSKVGHARKKAKRGRV